MRINRTRAFALTGLALGTVLTGCTAGSKSAPPPSPRPTASVKISDFAGTWGGHTRSLVIAKDGKAKESVGDGCCHPIVDLTLQLDDPTGTLKRASFPGRITAITVHDEAEMSKPLPKVGQRVRLEFRNGVMTDPVTDGTYCADGHTSRRQAFNCGA